MLDNKAKYSGQPSMKRQSRAPVRCDSWPTTPKRVPSASQFVASYRFSRRNNPKSSPRNKRILLAYDGSVECRTALREGALLAKQLGAEVFLLSVLADTGAFLFAEVALAGATVQIEERFQEILDEGIDRLKKLGFDPLAKLVRGQPAEEIGKFAREVDADLIVVGHRRQSTFDRWWSGPKGAYLIDFTDCSLLVARNFVRDEAIEALAGGAGSGSAN
jgi:nucleotide-binding universal stress UspA family protein